MSLVSLNQLSSCSTTNFTKSFAVRTYHTQINFGREEARGAFLRVRGVSYNFLSLSKTSARKSRKSIPHETTPKLFTLWPERMSTVGQQIIDLSRIARPSVRVANQRVLYCLYVNEPSRGPQSNYIPFPENTRGVFYYHKAQADMPELCAGVRFRICDSLAQFEQGRDLLDSRGNVWGYKLLELVKHKEPEELLSLLRAESLIDEGLINDINKLDITRRVQSYQYSLSTPFDVNVAQSKERINYATRAKVVRLDFPRHIFSFRSEFIRSVRPMTGSIKVQFELSNLTEHKKLGPTLVVRVLDVLSPVTVDPLYEGRRVLAPVRGSLLHQIIQGKKRVVRIPLERQKMADDLLELMKTSWA